MMMQYLELVLLSAGLSFALTPLVCRLAVAIGAVDRPGERKIHEVPIPRLGGVGVVLSGILTLVIAMHLDRIVGHIVDSDLLSWTPMLIGGAIIFLVGIWDDLKPVPAWVKFLFQAVAACVPILLGIRVDRISIFGGGTLDLGILALPFTFLWIVGLTNAFNLIDGLDGLAAGLASIAAGTCAAIFILRGDPQDAMLLLILVGALGGFLWYNFNPARVFLGDSGSLLIGYLLAVTSITGSQKGATALAVVIPLLVFGLPILDTLLSMIRRFVAGLRILKPYKAPLKEKILVAKMMFEGDQGHIHHRLIALGFSHRHAVLALYAIAIGLSCMALLSVLAQFRNAGIILLAVGLATYVGIRKLGYKEVVFLRTGTLLRWYEQLAFNRRFFLGFLDLVFIASAYWISFVLKYDFLWTTEIKNWYLGAWPLVLLVQLGILSIFGLNVGVWRAVGIGDLIRVVAASGSAVALSCIISLVYLPPPGVVTFFCIDVVVLAALMGGARSTYPILSYFRQREEPVREGVLIYGAGEGGQLLLRGLLQNPQLGLKPIGFLDDNATLQGRTVNRMPVLGAGQHLAAILEELPVSSVILSTEKIDGEPLAKVMDLCRARNIPVFQGRFVLQPMNRELGNLPLLNSVELSRAAGPETIDSPALSPL